MNYSMNLFYGFNKNVILDKNDKIEHLVYNYYLNST